MVVVPEPGLVAGELRARIRGELLRAGRKPPASGGLMPLLFLSHAGADLARALELADAIEASPEAQAAGLEVWVDQRPQGANRLLGGTPWQEQLETAIAHSSSAFGLLLTKEGARNWVRLEVRVALDRVIAAQRAGGAYPFIPIIADDMKDIDALPPFARQYQGVRLTAEGHGLADLIRVAAGLDATKPVQLVAQPFLGLEAFEAKDAALFFGRRDETQALVERLKATNLVMVVGDSGSGKSSLVKAGLVPAFREGALADPLGRRPEPGAVACGRDAARQRPVRGAGRGPQAAATRRRQVAGGPGVRAGQGDPHPQARLDPRRAAPVRSRQGLSAAGRRPVRGAVDAHRRRRGAARFPGCSPGAGAIRRSRPARGRHHAARLLPPAHRP